MARAPAALIWINAAGAAIMNSRGVERFDQEFQTIMHGDVVILHRKPGMTQMAIGTHVPRASLSEQFVDLLDQQERLCDQLEAVADELPNGVCWLRCDRLASSLGLAVRKAHRFEEERIFPLLSKGANADDGIVQSIARLEWEHMEDESYADEIAEAISMRRLQTLETSRSEGLGYMLRGFFESMRRHIAFERECVLPRLIASETGPTHV
ncbi:hemerythrin domain-containing protein [Fulvimarina sp. 2208YS6-2-32]|uniref:Hemerythrin domain-containing protein n=1 Tax=Fulvimarina uroteuthidis TaxID=3098149 RepID=A0ABU5I385_9HYPH|nr:hemerythrin domain-containing protein [Fulvimarina sp. 2208YS6-2-32]MDY8109830.1 hemerythrin domain-containing protein [Fulvimarina sp. 2208YS6-2-32]